MSDTLPCSVPAVDSKLTVAPPPLRLLPPASFNCTVIVDKLTASLARTVGLAVISDMIALAGPDATVKVLLDPFSVPAVLVAVRV